MIVNLVLFFNIVLTISPFLNSHVGFSQKVNFNYLMKLFILSSMAKLFFKIKAKIYCLEGFGALLCPCKLLSHWLYYFIF